MGRKKIKPDKIVITLNDMCDLVNTKYNLRPNQIGSIEYYSSMTENSIVQIMNQYRGIRKLISGPGPVLKQYLQNILDNKTLLDLNLYKM